MFEGARYDGYIHTHRLHEVVNDAVSEVLAKMPHDPYALLAEKFARMSKAANPSLRRPSIDTSHGLPIEADQDGLASSLEIPGKGTPTGRVGTSMSPARSFFRSPQAGKRAAAAAARQSFCNKQSLSAAERLGPKFLEKLLHISLDLCSNVTQSDVLLPVIIESSQELLSADRCSLFVLEGEFLVTQIKPAEVIRVHRSTGLAGHCATTGEPINLEDAYSDPRFNRTVDDMTGYRTQSLLCAPILCDGEVVAVAQLLNKTIDGASAAFTTSDLELFKTYAAFAGLAIHNAGLYNEQENLMQRNRFFVSVLESLSQADMRNWPKVVSDVSKGAAAVLHSEKCTLFVVDKEKSELCYAGQNEEIRFPSWAGVAGHVYTTGEMLNLNDPYNDRRFNPEIDKQTGFKTRSLLTVPVKHMGQVIAVAQVVNKLPVGEAFTRDDEETLNYFAHFAGVTLSNSTLYEFVLDSRNKAMALFEKQLEVLGGKDAHGVKGSPRHSHRFRRGTLGNNFSVDDIEVARCKNVVLDDEEKNSVLTRHFDIHQYSMTSREAQDKLVALTSHMFAKLGVLEAFSLSPEKLVAFICAVRKKYRRIPYHNFMHCVDVTQTLFTYLTEGACADLLTPLDCLGLLVCGLLHDVDHMGLNNSFHFKTESPMGILSSASGAASVLEVHHCNIGLQLLELDPFNVFATLTKEQLGEVYPVIISSILATDMAKHDEVLEQMTELEEYDKDNPEHRKLLCNLLLKAADISNITKPFSISRKWGVCVTEEFHMQGTEGRMPETGPTPLDHEMCLELAVGQCDFINNVGIKLYELLARLIPTLSWPSDELYNNLRQWSEIVNV